MSGNEILAMPDPDNYTENYSNLHKTDDKLTYNFGSKRGIFSSGNIVLIIMFDNREAATSCDIICHSW